MTEFIRRLQFEECRTDKEIVDFWDKLGLLNGIENNFKKECVAKAFHKTAKKILDEDKYANDDFPFNNFSAIIFPIIRRVIMDPYYKEINDFDNDFFENIINDCTFDEMLKYIPKDRYNKLLELDIYDAIKEALSNKTFHDIMWGDCERLTEQDIDLKAEAAALMAVYYVQKIKEKNEREKEEKRTEMA